MKTTFERLNNRNEKLVTIDQTRFAFHLFIRYLKMDFGNMEIWKTEILETLNKNSVVPFELFS